MIAIIVVKPIFLVVTIDVLLCWNTVVYYIFNSNLFVLIVVKQTNAGVGQGKSYKFIKILSRSSPFDHHFLIRVVC